jgi:hypothetical protein
MRISPVGICLQMFNFADALAGMLRRYIGRLL